VVSTGVTYNRSLNEMLRRLHYFLKPQLYLYFDEACKVARKRNNIVDIGYGLGNRGIMFDSMERQEVSGFLQSVHRFRGPSSVVFSG
jgi:hypothetical protein